MAVWSIVRTSEASLDSRCDAEFFRPEFLEVEKTLRGIEAESLAKHFRISDGNHLSVSRFFDQKKPNVPYFRGQDLNRFFLENASPVRIPNDIYFTGNMRRSHFAAEDVLMCIVGASTGTISLVPAEVLPATGSCKIGLFRKKESSLIDAFVLTAFLLGSYGQNQIKRNIRGTAQGGIILKDMFRLRVPLFDAKSSRKIRALLEASLKANRQSQNSYYEAGCLLEAELGLDKLSFKKPNGYTAQFSDLELSRRADAQHYQPQFTALLKHLETFPTTKLRTIKKFNRRGVQPIYVSDGPVSIVNSQHLGQRHISYETLERTSKAHFNAAPVAHVQLNDLLIYTTGAYIGRTNVYLSDTPALASNHVNILRLQPEIDSAYMGLVMQGIIGQFQTQKHARGSAQAELYPSDIDKFVVPLLPLETQKAIGDLLRESLITQLESKRLLEEAKARVEQLVRDAVKL